jgi:hypothetical protein
MAQQPSPAPKRRGPGRPPKSAAGDIEAAKKAWLAAFPDHGWDGACRIAGIAISTPSSWRRIDPAFHTALEALDVEIADRYEKIADEAINGQRQMDRSAATLLIFRLKALRPRKYRERTTIEHTGADGGAIKIENGDASAGARMLREWGARIGVERN